MKETKKILCHFSFYDQVKIQEKLEEMAEQGWMVDQPGNFTWTFRRMEPKKLRFSVTYFPSASEFDPGPTESEINMERLIDLKQDVFIKLYVVTSMFLFLEPLTSIFLTILSTPSEE